MPYSSFSDDDEPLVDTTVAIPLNSKRTARLQRKKIIRDKKQNAKPTLANLPTELLIEILKILLPSDVISFSFTSRRLNSVVVANANLLGNKIIKRRYQVLSQCFQLPVRRSDLDSSTQALLIEPHRQKGLSIHRNPYQHIRPPDPYTHCTCLTCILTWNSLCVALDFAHWQDTLDGGEPIPIIPRGQSVDWNEDLVARNARIVQKATTNSLWHARILEEHLDSTVRAIRRQQANKGNQRKHTAMSAEEAASLTDEFLEKAGPPSFEMPFNRDQYYLLEAYLPRRVWSSDRQRWIYNVPGSHEQDIAYLINQHTKSVVKS